MLQGAVESQLKATTSELKRLASDLTQAKVAGNRDRIQHLSELICIQSRSVLITYFDAIGWSDEMNRQQPTLAVSDALDVAASAAEGTRYERRVRNRQSDLAEYLRQLS